MLIVTPEGHLSKENMALHVLNKQLHMRQRCERGEAAQTSTESPNSCKTIQYC